MATLLVEKLWICVLIFQACLIGKCEAYSTTWWSVWYFWVVLFAVLACCCGAAGSYYRRRQYATIRRTQQTVVVGTLPPGAAPGQHGYPAMGNQSGQPPIVYPPYPGSGANRADPYAPPVFPTSPVQPPSYTEGFGNHGYSAGENKNTMAPPPAYSEVMAQTSAADNK